MVLRPLRNGVLAFCLAVLVAALAVGQSDGSDLELSLSVDGWFPGLVRPQEGLTTGLGADLQASFLHVGPFSLLARGGFHAMQTAAASSLGYAGAAVGVRYIIPLGERLDLTAAAYAGLGRIPDATAAGFPGESYGLYELGAKLNLRYRVTAGLRAGAVLGYERLATPASSFVDTPAIGIGFWIVPGEMLRSRGKVEIEEVNVEPIFPVLRSWYDEHPLGTVTIRNLEDGPIEQVRVFFRTPDYMGGERLSSRIERIESGAAVEVPLFAVFDERVLTLTENTSTVAELTVEYSYYGAELTARETFPLQIYHRNTMTWVDDRRAGAFVSPTNPAALWFARSASSVARDRMRANLPQNMQIALAVFEALRLYGLNYVIDPNSSYIELSQNASAIDFLQYPGETLAYRGGDCDDLSIVYASLLESVGISTAFITIPGHIYLAFDLGLTEEEALEQFFDPGLLIIRDGRAWAPVEVTMVREGFVKAWRVGAKQWIDNQSAGNTAFFAMEENWLQYPPSALPDAATRFELPEQSALMAAFDDAVDRFVFREMSPVMAEFESELSVERDPRKLNDYGVELANAGMLDEAWDRFAEAADAGYAWAWNNLANIAFIRRDYELARDYFQWADGLLPGDPVATLGLARTNYELDRYQESEVLYASLSQGAPVLAERFAYLASVYGGSGRAWSMADRLASTVWSRPGLDFSRPIAVATLPETDQEIAAAPEPQPAATPGPEPVTTTMPQPANESEAQPEVVTAESAAEPAPPTPPAREPEIAPEPEVAVAIVTEPEPEPAVTPAPEPETTTAPQPASQPEAAATLQPEPEPEPDPETVESPPPPLPALATVSVPATEPAVSPVQPAAAEEPAAPEPRPAPPAILMAAPEDAEIAERRASEGANANEADTGPPPASVIQPPVRAPEPVPAPPEIQVAAPEDAEIVERKAAEAVEESENRTAAQGQTQTVVVAPPTRQENVAETPGEPDEPATPEPQPAPESISEPESTPESEPQAVAQVIPEEAQVDEPEQPGLSTAPAPVGEQPSETTEEPQPEPAEDLDEPVEPVEPAQVVQREPLPEQLVDEPEAVIASLTTRTEPEAEPQAARRVWSWTASDRRLDEGPIGQAIGSRATLVTPQTAETKRLVSYLEPSVSSATGNWDLRANQADMTEPSATYAKLVVPTDPVAGVTSYSITARSTGSGWIGLGIHIHGRGSWTHTHYGGGDSILVWLTSDRATYGDDRTRLQIYRSTGEWQMEMLRSTSVPGSILNLHEYMVDYDPERGTLRVTIDGRTYLSMDSISSPPDSNYVILRALDTAEFRGLSIRPTDEQDPRGTR